MLLIPGFQADYFALFLFNGSTQSDPYLVLFGIQVGAAASSSESNSTADLREGLDNFFAKKAVAASPRFVFFFLFFSVENELFLSF